LRHLKGDAKNTSKSFASQNILVKIESSVIEISESV